MSYPEAKELIQAENLIEEGKIEKALQLVNDFGKKKDLPYHERIFICYVFKGQSYSAQHRIRYFLDKIQRNKDVWKKFETFLELNQEIQLKDIPSLEHLITEVFIERKIV